MENGAFAVDVVILMREQIRKLIFFAYGRGLSAIFEERVSWCTE